MLKLLFILVLLNIPIVLQLQDRSGTVVQQNFSDMYKHLPNLLPEKDRKELTCPLAFVALLHLSNEQNLALTQLPSYKDFNIKGPK